MFANQTVGQTRTRLDGNQARTSDVMDPGTTQWPELQSPCRGYRTRNLLQTIHTLHKYTVTASALLERVFGI